MVVGVADEGALGVVVRFVLWAWWQGLGGGWLFDVGRVDDGLHEEKRSVLVYLEDGHDIELFSEW